jgi:hypothetical protein
MGGVDGDPLAHNIRAPAEAALPEPVGQNSDTRSGWGVFAGREGPAQERGNA